VTIWETIAADANVGAERLVAEYGDRLLTSACRITQNHADAEDLVFRTFSQVIARIGQYSGRSDFLTWMYAILLNFRRMDLRRKSAQALVFTDNLPEQEDPAPDPAVRLNQKNLARFSLVERPDYSIAFKFCYQSRGPSPTDVHSALKKAPTRTLVSDNKKPRLSITTIWRTSRLSQRRAAVGIVMLCAVSHDLLLFAPWLALRERFVLASEAVEVRKAIGKLPEPLREVIVLAYYEEMDVSTIAGLLKCPVGTVKSRLHRARSTLARHLAGTVFRDGASNDIGEEVEARKKN